MSASDGTGKIFNYGYGTQFEEPSSESMESPFVGYTEFFSLNRSRLNGLADPVIEYRTTGNYSNEGGAMNLSTLNVQKRETAGGLLSDANGVAYARHPATALISSATHPQSGGGPILKATHVRDGIGRLKRMETGIQGGATKAYMEYTYVNGQRDQAETDRGMWHYGYNGRGEVVSGVKKITNSTVPGYSFGYQFDGIGNRETATTNGITDVYTPNALNQYEQRTVPAYFQVRGLATSAPPLPPGVEPDGVAVKLEGAQSPYTAAGYDPLKSNYYGLALPVPAPGNQNNALWKGITIEAWANTGTNEYKKTETRKEFLPKSPEDYDYDDDGNLTKDGRWTYQWDAENRLIQMTARTADFPGGTPPMGLPRLDFQYDLQGRRTAKLVYGSDDVLVRSCVYFYDGWTLLLEIERHHDSEDVETLSQIITRKYIWGPDLSGEPAGAGGVGGLQRVEITSQSPSASKTLIPAYDGNGNIVAYLDHATGEIVQEEEYGPFGESLRSRGTSPLRSPLGWSSKYTDEETGLVYYGYRYYAPQTGRWINRDPIGETGGANVYSLVRNRPPQAVDALGLDETFTAMTFIPTNYVLHPAGAIAFGGDSFSHDLSKGRPSARTRQTIKIKTEGLPDNPTGSDIVETVRRNVGETLKYMEEGRSGEEAYRRVVAARVPVIVIDGRYFYLVDRATADANKQFSFEVTESRVKDGKLCYAYIVMKGHGSNPIAPKPILPEINYELNITYQGHKSPKWDVWGNHDGFPTYVFFKGDERFHHHHAGNPMELFGSSDTQIPNKQWD